MQSEDKYLTATHLLFYPAILLLNHLFIKTEMQNDLFVFYWLKRPRFELRPVNLQLGNAGNLSHPTSFPLQ